MRSFLNFAGLVIALLTTLPSVTASIQSQINAAPTAAAMEPDLRKAGTNAPLTRVMAQLLVGRACSICV